MIHALDYLREMNFLSVTFRLVLAMLCGGIIGMERGRRHRTSGLAGLRTYMLVCVGAALTIELSLYEYNLLTTVWNSLASEIGIRTDVSRFGAQVINGIGFLGAGTIIVTGNQEVKGLTTAAGLWASGCMGLAIGAGFYEVVLLAVILILLSVSVLARMESRVVEYAPSINLFVEYESMNDIGAIISCIKNLNARIYEVDIDRGDLKRGIPHSAVFNIRMNSKMSHTEFITSVAQLSTITTIYEI